MATKRLSARKRPRQERARATVEAILQAATYILVNRGWRAFTTNEVARKAGVNIASLYQYFPNKESIVAELRRRHLEELGARWPEPDRAGTLADALRTMLESVVREHRVNPALHRVFSEELPRQPVSDPVDDGPMRRWAAHVGTLMHVPDAGLASFITRVVVHEAATVRPELLDHPLLVPELVRLLTPWLSGLRAPRGSSSRRSK